MTPQERELVDELFERLAALESAPRDPDAVRAINDGLGRAPNALYALVQTAIVQDEALKRANARIAELEGQGAEPPRQGGFLDNMREALLGRGSVPSVRQAPAGAPGWTGGPPPPPGSAAYGQYAQPAAPIGSGGSFLGTAAASAAGVIGGAMLLNGIRSMFGHSSNASAYDPGVGAMGSPMSSPWGGGAADSDLSRQLGIDHIGGGGGERRESADRAGFFGNDDQPQDASYDNDDDTDLAGDFDSSDDNA